MEGHCAEEREQPKRRRDSPQSWGQQARDHLLRSSPDGSEGSQAASQAKKQRPTAAQGEACYPAPLTHEHFDLVLQVCCSSSQHAHFCALCGALRLAAVGAHLEESTSLPGLSGSMIMRDGLAAALQHVCRPGLILRRHATTPVVTASGAVVGKLIETFRGCDAGASDGRPTCFADLPLVVAGYSPRAHHAYNLPENGRSSAVTCVLCMSRTAIFRPMTSFLSSSATPLTGFTVAKQRKILA